VLACVQEILGSNHGRDVSVLGALVEDDLGQVFPIPYYINFCVGVVRYTVYEKNCKYILKLHVREVYNLYIMVFSNFI